MLFSIKDLKETEDYRNAIFQGYKIYIDYNDVFLKFKIRKGKKESSLSGKIKTLKEFQGQLRLFISTLNT
jgi:hypothetical protein